MLPKEAIEEFKEIHENVFGEKVGNAEAARRANKLMDFYRAVLDTPPATFDTRNKSYEQGSESE